LKQSAAWYNKIGRDVPLTVTSIATPPYACNQLPADVRRFTGLPYSLNKDSTLHDNTQHITGTLLQDDYNGTS